MLNSDQTKFVAIKRGFLTLLALGTLLSARAEDASGLWKWSTPNRSGGPDRVVNLKLAIEGRTLTGKIYTPNRTNDTFAEVEIKDGTIQDGELSFTVSRGGRGGGAGIVTKYTGKLKGDKIEGKIETPSRDGEVRALDWKAERNTTGQLIAGEKIVLKPGYDENGNKIVNETHYKEVSVDEAEKFLAGHPEAIILDARSPEEFAAGHLPNAKNYNLTDKDTYKSLLAGLDKSKWYVVHSAVGHYRTVRALEYFEANGFEHAIAIDGGYAAWAKAGKPTVK